MDKTIKINTKDHEWIKANADGRTIKGMIAHLIKLVSNNKEKKAN